MTEKKTPLRLVQGEFIRGKEKVKACFGDLEQIKLLREAEYLHEQYKDNGLIVEPEFEEIKTMEMDVVFTCICGTNLHHSDEIECDHWGDLDEDPSDFKKTCSCGQKYEGKYDEQTKEYNIKFANN